MDKSPETAWLDRGDGVCQNFDESSHRCRVYADRPLICRVEDYYEQHFSHAIGWNEFIKINLEICAKL